jgi:hypothetical protein
MMPKQVTNKKPSRIDPKSTEGVCPYCGEQIDNWMSCVECFYCKKPVKWDGGEWVVKCGPDQEFKTVQEAIDSIPLSHHGSITLAQVEHDEGANT